MKLLTIFCATFVFALVSSPVALADSGAGLPVAGPAQMDATPAANACRVKADGIKLAQTSQAECCKGHKGVCGCRAGKIVCCDGTASTVAGCTCHGDDSFVE